MNDLETLALEIAETLDKGEDVPFRRRMQNSIIQLRATLYKQQYDKTGRFPAGSEDSITLPMKVAPVNECLNGEIDCVVFRTNSKVPRPIRKNFNSVPFAFVGSMNQEVSFIFTKPEEVRSLLEGTKFIKTNALYMYFNDYIYTVNHDAGKVTIRETFADPRELLTLLDCDKKPCKTIIELDEDMKRTIKMMVFEELRQFNNLPEDKTIRINE